MSTANGLTQVSYTTCTICQEQSPEVSGDPEYAQRDLRKLGWRPERVAQELRLGKGGDSRVLRSTKTRWYCQAHEQMRPSLKKNQVAS